MTDKEFDNIVKTRLHNYKSNVPGDMWRRIHSREKKRRFIFIIWFAAALLVATISGYYFVSNRNYISTAKNISSDKKNNPQPNKISEQKEINSINTKISNDAIIQPVKLFSKIENVRHLQQIKELTTIATDNNVQNKIISSTNQESLKDKKNISDIKQKHVDSSDIKNSDSDELTQNDDSAHNDKFYVELFAAPVVAVNNFQSTNSNYLTLLRSNSHFKLSYAIGLNIGVVVTKNLSIKTGIHYTQINQQVHFNDSAANGLKESINRYKFFDVPFMLSYKLNNTRDIHTSLNAGFALNIASKYKGFMPDEFGSKVNIKNNFYKKNTGISLYAGVNFSKAIYKKTNVFIEPYFQFRTGSITNQMQSFDQHLHAAGISIGLKQQLFRRNE